VGTRQSTVTPVAACSASRPMSPGTRGNIYISDGYINRGCQVRHAWPMVKSWASRAPSRASSILPHAIAIDNNDNVYVGDRSNHRIQVF